VSFYTTVMGMKAGQPSNFGALEETLLSGGGLGFALAIVHYTTGARNYKDNPVKVVFPVPDAAAATLRIQQAGQMVITQPMPVAALGNATLGVVKDPDGYMLELLQR
jgi:predicted enzyme related to lactoylglutathione lyase